MISFNNEGPQEEDFKGGVDDPTLLSPEDRYERAVEMSGPVPNSLLYKQKVVEGKVTGFFSGDTLYKFNDGEELVYEKVEGEKDRVEFIRLKDGSKISIDKWIETNGQV